MRTWTPQQEAYFSALLNTNEPLLLEAVAGSGKTSTLIEGLIRQAMTGVLPRTVVCCFNKHIQEEFERKLKAVAVELEKAGNVPAGALLRSVEVRTMNSLGYRAWGRTVRGKLMLEPRKVYHLAREIFPRGPDNPMNCSDFPKLLSFARSTEYKPCGNKRFWLDLMEQIEFEPEDFDQDYLAGCAEQLLLRMNGAGLQGMVDFTDQLYLPVVFQSSFETFDQILVDEVQDLAPLQHEMLRRMRGLHGRIIAAGDRYQAIYAFRGAAAESIDNMIEKFRLRPMPLTVSFRCPKSVVSVAQEIVPHIESAPGASEGTVGSSRVLDIAPGDFVVSRYNAPLVQCWLKLIKRGLGASIIGKDIGTSLVNMLRKHSESQDLRRAFLEMMTWVRAEQEKFRMQDKPERAESLSDRAEAIEAICEDAPAGTNVSWFERKVLQMFSDHGSVITLSTIHKAKGLEFRRVHFLCREALPPKRARGPGARQEMNLIYVGVTRAMEELFFLSRDELERPLPPRDPVGEKLDEIFAPQELRSAPSTAPLEPPPKLTGAAREAELRKQEEFLAAKRAKQASPDWLDELLEDL